MIGKTSSGIGFKTIGAGKDVVLLRGLGRWSEHWCDFPERLAGSFRVTLIDNRGFGMSSEAALRPLDKIEDMADDIAEAVTAAQLVAPTLVGVSLGGMIAMATAARHPVLLSRLMIINSSVAGSPYPRITPAALAALGRKFTSPKTFYSNLARVLLGPEESLSSLEKMAADWSRIDTNSSMSPARVFMQLLASARFSPEGVLDRIKLPTQVVKSGSDLFVDPRNSDWISSKIKGSKLVVCEKGGHELSFDHADWLKSQIVSFVEL